MGRNKKRPTRIPAQKKSAAVPAAEIRAALRKGVALFQSGRLLEAERLFQSILVKDPKNVNALQFMGLVQFQKGQPKEAEQQLRRAIRQKPGIAGLHYNLGMILDGQGKLDKAVVAYEEAARLDAANEWVHNNLGLVLCKLGRLDKAERALGKALEINPKNSPALSNLGLVLWRSSRLDEAIETFEQVLEHEQDSIEALSNLGTIYFSRKELDKAEEYLRRALDVEEQHFNTINNLAGVLLAKDGLDEAEALFGKALELNPESTDAMVNMAKLLMRKDDEKGAEDIYRRALGLDPNSLDALNGLGGVLSSYGQFDEARECYQKALKISAESPAAHVGLMRIDPPEASGDVVKKLEQLYENPEISLEDRKLLAFGLASVFENGAEYDKAFFYLANGNRLKRESYDYSLEDEKGFFDAIKAVFNEELFTRVGGDGCQDRTPIFILGMPRSGTTLTEQILASHPQVFGAGELNDLENILLDRCGAAGYARFSDVVSQLETADIEKMGADYVDQLRTRSESAGFITDKMPHNFLHVGLIRLILPEAKVIHCRREPMDNCLSIYKHDFRGSHKYAYDQHELGGYYSLYQDLMDHWHQVLPGFVLDFQYEELIADQEAMTRRLLEFCDLPWDEGCLQFHRTERAVRTASKTQVRREIYSDSVQLWRRYEHHLKPLKDALSSNIE